MPRETQDVNGALYKIFGGIEGFQQYLWDSLREKAKTMTDDEIEDLQAEVDEFGREVGLESFCLDDLRNSENPTRYLMHHEYDTLARLFRVRDVIEALPRRVASGDRPYFEKMAKQMASTGPDDIYDSAVIMLCTTENDQIVEQRKVA